MKAAELRIGALNVSADILNQYLRFTGHKVTYCALDKIQSDFLLYTSIVALHCKHINTLKLAQCSLGNSVRDLLSACSDLKVLAINQCTHLSKHCFLGVNLPSLVSLRLENCQWCDDSCVAAAVPIISPARFAKVRIIKFGIQPFS